MMRDIYLLKSVEEIYTMSDIIWGFHVYEDAFISRHASFPMTKTRNKNKTEAKKNGSKRVIANDTDSKLPGVLCCCCFLFSHVHALSMKLTAAINTIGFYFYLVNIT